MEILGNCPKCSKCLKLQQINFKAAVFICPDVKCPYPTDGECMVVRRSIENIKEPVDLYAQLKKQESQNGTETTEEYPQSSLMSDLEDLMSFQTNSQFEKNIQEPANKAESLQNISHNVSTGNSSHNDPLAHTGLDELLANFF